MNLQLRSNDASRSDDVFCGLEYKVGALDAPFYFHLAGRSTIALSPVKVRSTPYYGIESLNASPHKKIIYIFPNVLQRTQRSILLNNFHQQIIGLKNLSVGWDSYNAEPPNYVALTRALSILDFLSEIEFNPTRIMPSVEGGISFLFVRNTKYADIECDNDGDILAGMSDRTGDPILWQVNEQIEGKSLIESISKIRSFLET